MHKRPGLWYLRRPLTLTFVLLLCLLAWSRPLVALVPQTTSPWLSPDAPSLEINPNQSPVIRTDYNRDCWPETGTIRQPTETLTHMTTSGCATYAPYGKFIGSRLQLNNSGLYGLLYDGVTPIPGSADALRKPPGDPDIGRLYLVHDYPSRLTSQRSTDSQVTYFLKPTDPIYLRDSLGDTLNIHYDTMSFSPNGEWMVAIANMRLVSYNLKTHQSTMIDQDYYAGKLTSLQTAVSANGRYAVVYSGMYDRFRLYDLDTCGGNLLIKSCQYRDILPRLPVPSTRNHTYYELRFLSDYTLSFYLREVRDSQTVWTRHIVTAAGQQKITFDYLALGDSFASGEGAYDYRPGTDTPDNKCHNSRLSYPYLIKTAISMNTVESVACSGAVMRDIFGDNSYAAQAGGNQPQTLSSLLTTFLPGYLPQSSFLDQYAPSAITISVGGNNIGFGRKILRCIEADTCYSSYEDRLEMVREINSKFDDLVKLYQSLKQSSPTSAKIYVIGYPELVKNGGNCSLNVRLNANEIEMSNLLIGHLNHVLERAAQKAGVAFVDTADIFNGHRLCESMPAVHGLTYGDDKIDWWFIHGPIGNESYHPNILGHQLLRDRLLNATNNLTLLMPVANPAILPPDDNNASALLNAPRSHRPIYIVNYDDDLSNNVIVRETWWDATVESVKSAFKPLSTVYAVLRSEPVELGEFTTDEHGNLSAQLSIPASVPHGFHTLHLYGENLAGEPIDYYKIIYVGAYEDDFDGDGINNHEDHCLNIAGTHDKGICREEVAVPTARPAQGTPDQMSEIGTTKTQQEASTLTPDITSTENALPPEPARVAAGDHDPGSTNTDISAVSFPVGAGGILLMRRHNKKRLES